ncbi:MAG: glucose-6-phosphate dehydrogenase [Nitrospirae bacterium]|nr:glucose-6-phosphate dehydrogenase [Nitrospirota bacterium]MCL5238195.1 glucose-6-phosphate dehydrogenase [Nitrospirota bacterium]
MSVMESPDMMYSRFLQTCDIPVEGKRIEPFTMVIFGGAGDLSQRKLLPSIFYIFRENVLAGGFSLLGFDRTGLSDEQYRTVIKGAVREFGREPFDEGTWDEFSGYLNFLSGDLEDDEKFGELRKRVDQIAIPDSNGNKNVIYYMALPPQVTPLVVKKLKEHNLAKGEFRTKIIVEKPFGHDLRSAEELNKILLDAFDENQIYRIDHYLGKDSVQNIIFFRFTNTIFEEIWNRHYIDNVQITVAEDIGIEHRGAFYERAGVVRDIVQNHIMQIFGLIAMEPPIAFKADFIRDEKLKILRAVHHMDEGYLDKFMVSGQYGPGTIRGRPVAGYREEKNVSPISNAPTFFAGKFYIDNLRWAGVPFYIRTGKRLPTRITEICLQFKQLPVKLFGRTCDTLEPNIIILTIQPDEKIALRFGVKYPYSESHIYHVNMVFNYNETFKMKVHPPYERLLIDCMRGDLTLFVREDTVEEMWAIVDPILSRWEGNPPEDFPNYAAGDWGPAAAYQLLERENRKWITS